MSNWYMYIYFALQNSRLTFSVPHFFYWFVIFLLIREVLSYNVNSDALERLSWLSNGQDYLFTNTYISIFNAFLYVAPNFSF